MGLPRRRWTKLRSRLYPLMINSFQIHIALWRMRSEPMPRFWITLGYGKDQQVVFDYPHCEEDIHERQKVKWQNHMDIFSELISEYVNTSPTELITKTWANDKYGLIDIFKACDRRIDYRRLQVLASTLYNEQAIRIVQQRLSQYEKKARIVYGESRTADAAAEEIPG